MTKITITKKIDPTSVFTFINRGTHFRLEGYWTVTHSDGEVYILDHKTALENVLTVLATEAWSMKVE